MFRIGYSVRDMKSTFLTSNIFLTSCILLVTVRFVPYFKNIYIIDLLRPPSYPCIPSVRNVPLFQKQNISEMLPWKKTNLKNISEMLPWQKMHGVHKNVLIERKRAGLTGKLFPASVEWVIVLCIVVWVWSCYVFVHSPVLLQFSLVAIHSCCNSSYCMKSGDKHFAG